MNSTMPTTGDLYLVVGYDGSAPAVRALDAAAALLRGRNGGIDVIYVPHMPSVDMVSPEAVAGMRATLDEIARDLHAQASEQLRDREERWRFERGQDMITNVTDVLIGAAAKVRDAHPTITWRSWSGARRRRCTVWSVRWPSTWRGTHRYPS